MTAEEKALEFFNESYSGSDASGFIKPYVINAFKAGGISKDHEIAELKSINERLVKACDYLKSSRNSVDEVSLELHKEVAELKAEIERLSHKTLCPKCGGEGYVHSIGSTTSLNRICPVCNGIKLI